MRGPAWARRRVKALMSKSDSFHSCAPSCHLSSASVPPAAAAAAAAASTSPQPSAKRENVNGAFHAAEDKQRRGALSGRGRKAGSVFFFFPHRERGFLLSDRGAHKQSPEPHSPPASQGDCATINHRDLNGEQSAEEGGGSGAGLREL